MKKILIILTALSISVAFLTTSAFATPNFASKTGKSCSYCHSSVPSLNATGQAFAANGFQLPVIKTPTVKPVPVPVVTPAPEPKPVVVPTKPVAPKPAVPNKVVTPTKPTSPKVQTVTIKKPILKLAIKNQVVDSKSGVPFILNGVTYVPLRAMVVGMGDKLTWDGKTIVAKVTTHKGIKVSFPLGKSVVISNGKQVAIAGKSLRRNGLVYVPLMAVSKHLYPVEIKTVKGVTTYNVGLSSVGTNLQKTTTKKVVPIEQNISYDGYQNNDDKYDDESDD